MKNHDSNNNGGNYNIFSNNIFWRLRIQNIQNVNFFIRVDISKNK